MDSLCAQPEMHMGVYQTNVYTLLYTMGYNKSFGAFPPEVTITWYHASEHSYISYMPIS